MNKLYTRTGDSGKTDCLGQRVNKDTSLIELIGTIDELNAFIGNIYDQDVKLFHKEILFKIQNEGLGSLF